MKKTNPLKEHVIDRALNCKALQANSKLAVAFQSVARLRRLCRTKDVRFTDQRVTKPVLTD